MQQGKRLIFATGLLSLVGSCKLSQPPDNVDSLALAAADAFARRRHIAYEMFHSAVPVHAEVLGPVEHSMRTRAAFWDQTFRDLLVHLEIERQEEGRAFYEQFTEDLLARLSSELRHEVVVDPAPQILASLELLLAGYFERPPPQTAVLPADDGPVVPHNIAELRAQAEMSPHYSNLNHFLSSPDAWDVRWAYQQLVFRRALDAMRVQDRRIALVREFAAWKQRQRKDIDAMWEKEFGAVLRVLEEELGIDVFVSSDSKREKVTARQERFLGVRLVNDLHTIYGGVGALRNGRVLDKGSYESGSFEQSVVLWLESYAKRQDGRNLAGVRARAAGLAHRFGQGSLSYDAEVSLQHRAFPAASYAKYPKHSRERPARGKPSS